MNVKNEKNKRLVIILLALVCLSIGVERVKGEFIKTVYTAVMSGANVTPSVGPEVAFGVAVCVYDRNSSPKELDCEVQFDLSSEFGPFTAGIYLGAVSSVGPLLYPFTVDLSTNHFRQVFQLTSLSSSSFSSLYTVKEQEIDFLNGDWYIEISSPLYLNGDLRGNLLHEHLIYARLKGQNMLPSPVNTTATALAIASYSLSPSRSASFSISHSVSNPTQIQIRRGTSSEIGAQDSAFSGDISSPIISSSIPYQSNTQDALEENDQYIQINSVSHNDGEIRGELNMIDYLPPVSFTARLDGLSVIPYSLTSSSGCALFSLDCSTQILTYFIYHTVSTPVSATINIGNQYESGPPLIQLDRAESPIYGSVEINSNTTILLYEQQLYITISSFLYPKGEIRGQVTDKYNYYSYITGTATLPPSTTSGLGCGTFRLAETTSSGRVLDYQILFNSKASVAMTVELMYGNPGAEGKSEFILNEHTSPAAGTDVYLTSTQEAWFGSSTMFVQIGDAPSLFLSSPELRGQIYAVQNPCPIIINDTIPDRHTSSTHEYIIPSSFNWINSSPSLLPSSLSFFVVFITLFYII